ncbi:hypothetical protein VZO05_16080 (plasmid) [Aggregatilineales bacterium SYSU G02658]
MTDPTPPDIEQVTQEIARHLNETLDGPVRQIRMVVTHMGVEFAREVLRETMAIESTGGMLTADQSRRRTPGGVFFYLAKGKMPAEARAIIFPLPYQAKRVPVVPWEDRLAIARQALEASAAGQSGSLTALPRLTLIGRPGPVFHEGSTVAFELQHELSPEMPFPRGIPQPPALTLRFLVLASRQQYERIEKALKKSLKERLIVEGICTLDPELNVILVLPVILTTRSNQKRAKADQRQPMITAEDEEVAIALPGHPVPHPTLEREKQQQRELYRRMKEKEETRAERTARKPAQAPTDAEPNQTNAASTDAPKPAKLTKPAAQPATVSAVPKPAVPSHASEAVLAQIRELELAAVTLRERISAMEAKKQPGVAMTKKILENTERQIEALRRDLSL